MTPAAAGSNEQRILLRTATTRDAALATSVLERAGMHAVTCATTADLADEYRRGAGVLLIAEEVLADPAFGLLNERLQTQAPWSDVPVLVLARTGADSRVIIEAMEVIASRVPKILEFGVADETAWKVGLSCGGRIRVLVEPVE
jgi:hypothetical protein